MRAKGKKRGAARVLAMGCAMVAPVQLALAPRAFAQTVPPPAPPTPPAPLQPVEGADIDPSAPLDAMPDLGVAWPDLGAPDPVPDAPLLTPDSAATANALVTDEAPAAEALVVTDDGAARRYTVVLSGIDTIKSGATIRSAFDAQSALIADRKEQANAAQIDRRTRADARGPSATRPC